MESILQAQDKFKNGSFILNDQQESYRPFRENDTLFLTQENNDSLKKEILKLIETSRVVLKVCSFIITDREVFNAVLTKAKEGAVPVFVLTQLDEKKLKNTASLYEALTEEEIRDNSAQTHLHCIKILYDHGVHIRAATTAHAKFIVADRTVGFLTSANLTTPSLTLNTESGIYLSPEDASQLDQLFDGIFQKGTRYRQYLTAGRGKNFIIQAEANITAAQLPNIQQSGLRFTYEQLTQNLYEEIIAILDGATEYIYLSTFSIVRLDKLAGFREAITRAISRKVKIEVFCRGMNYRNDHLLACTWLANAGCTIYADIFNHSKAIISERRGMLFTANIDGDHGLINGFETGVLLSERQRLLLLELQRYLIACSNYKFTAAPTRQQFFDTYTAYEKLKEMSPPEYPATLTITARPGVNVNITELRDQPIFTGKTKGQKYLMVGASLYKCNYKDGSFHLTEKEPISNDQEKYLLKYSTLKLIFN